MYFIERMIKTNGRNFQDGNHIIYVNGSYIGDDDIGRLMSDFRNRTESGFYNKVLEKSVLHFKYNEKGANEMKDEFDEYVEECTKDAHERGINAGEEKGRVTDIKSIMKTLKLTAEQAMNALQIPAEQHEKYMAML